MSGGKPDPKGPTAFVDEAYHLDSAEDMSAFYRKWAADYDRQMREELDYLSPDRIAQDLAEQIQEKDAAILDVGCGTGLTCRLLAERGYCHLDGVDLSQEMLDVARERGIYRRLIQADLNEPLPLDTAVYDGVISSGTFTHGHVGPQPLDELFRVLKPGGVLACTVHQDLWQSLGFDERLRNLVDQGVAELVSHELGPYFGGSPPEGWFCVYRRVGD